MQCFTLKYTRTTSSTKSKNAFNDWQVITCFFLIFEIKFSILKLILGHNATRFSPEVGGERTHAHVTSAARGTCVRPATAPTRGTFKTHLFDTIRFN